MPLLIALRLQKQDTLYPILPGAILYFPCLPAWAVRLPRLFTPMCSQFPSLQCLVPGTRAGRGDFHQHSWLALISSWLNSLKRAYFMSP